MNGLHSCLEKRCEKVAFLSHDCNCNLIAIEYFSEKVSVVVGITQLKLYLSLSSPFPHLHPSQCSIETLSFSFFSFSSSSSISMLIELASPLAGCSISQCVLSPSVPDNCAWLFDLTLLSANSSVICSSICPLTSSSEKLWNRATRMHTNAH